MEFSDFRISEFSVSKRIFWYPCRCILKKFCFRLHFWIRSSFIKTGFRLAISTCEKIAFSKYCFIIQNQSYAHSVECNGQNRPPSICTLYLAAYVLIGILRQKPKTCCNDQNWKKRQKISRILWKTSIKSCNNCITLWLFIVYSFSKLRKKNKN